MECDKCDETATLECACRRCMSEPEDEERFWACAAHRGEVDEAHTRIRGYRTSFYDLSRAPR